MFSLMWFSILVYKKRYVSLCVTKRVLLENHLRYMYIYIHFTTACFQKISNIKVQLCDVWEISKIFKRNKTLVCWEKAKINEFGFEIVKPGISQSCTLKEKILQVYIGSICYQNLRLSMQLMVFACRMSLQECLSICLMPNIFCISFYGTCSPRRYVFMYVLLLFSFTFSYTLSLFYSWNNPTLLNFLINPFSVVWLSNNTL